MGKRIAFVGAGAIGGYCGAHMTRVGEDVTLIDGWAEHVQMLRREGMTVTGMSPNDRFNVPVRALHISDVPQLIKEQPFDIVFISVKSYDTQWATMMMLPYIAPDGVFVSLQNSVNEDQIAGVAGWGRVMGCAVGGIGGELTGPGKVSRNTPVGNRERIGLKIGEVHGRITKRVETVVALLDHAEAAAPTTNLWGVRWSKLIINAMRNGVSAVTGLSGNQRDTDEITRWLSIRLGGQCVRVGQAMGLALENPGLEPETLARAGEGDKGALTAIIEQMGALIAHRNDEQRPSMGQDILKGRRTETDFINGLVARRGQEVAVKADLHVQVNDLVKQVERGVLKPSRDLIANL
jgi:2-dehydropantoate 2-reductase